MKGQSFLVVGAFAMGLMLPALAFGAPHSAIDVAQSHDILAHGGGTDSRGCHMDRKKKKQHCHGKPTKSSRSSKKSS